MLVVPPTPSWLLLAVRQGNKPREVLSNQASKDARVGAIGSGIIFIYERTTQ